MLRYERFKRRFWAVYEDDALLCVTVYLKARSLLSSESPESVLTLPPARSARLSLRSTVPNLPNNLRGSSTTANSSTNSN